LNKKRILIGILGLVLLVLAAAWGLWHSGYFRGSSRASALVSFRPGWRLPCQSIKVMTYNIEFGNRLDEALES